MAGHAPGSPILERVCNAWLRACGSGRASSVTSSGTIVAAGCRVSAHVSISRT